MKHTILSIRSAAFALLLFLPGACSSEFNELPVQDNPLAPLTIRVNMDDFSDERQVDTRAIDNGVHTFFQDGDCVGIIAIKAGSTTTQLTVTYDATNRSWTAAEGSSFNGTTTYVPYFPYDKNLTLTGINDESSALSAIKTAIRPKSDQRTAANYRASDLLTGSCTYSGSTLTISLSHTYSLLWLQAGTEYSTLDDYVYRTPLSDVIVNFNETSLQPNFSANGYRLVVDAGTSSLQSAALCLRWFYTLDGGKTYQITANTLPDAGKYCLYRNVTSGGIRPIKAGDYYYFDGNIVPNDAENPPAEGCIGIVCCTDVSRIGEAAVAKLKTLGVQKPHGLVMALTNASDGCRWGEYNKDENNGGVEGEPFYENTDKVNKMYDNVDGYGETHWIIDKYGSTTLQGTYSAFYHASRYGTTDSGTAPYAAPANTTGWFIPSMGQWWDILSNLGGIDLTGKQEDTSGSTSISGAATITVDNMNKYLEKISGATTFSKGTYFWSGSEYDGVNACRVGFYSGGDLYLNNYVKGDGHLRVRCSFAF